jgi:hypothetical protein
MRYNVFMGTYPILPLVLNILFQIINSLHTFDIVIILEANGHLNKETI